MTSASGGPYIAAEGLGVRYSIGQTREDVQSLVSRTIRGAAGRRDWHWALKDLSFSAGPGDIVGVIGGNGAGKSTLCRALAGLVRPDAGTLRIGGSASALLALGTGFHDELSGRENILLNGLTIGLTRRETAALVSSIVAFAGLGRFIDEPLKHYSSGMRARLGFAIGAAIAPEILILDETLGAGDAAFTDLAARTLERLIARARIAVVVTHQIGFVDRHCTQAIWLDAGRVRAHGEPGAVVAAYGAWVAERSGQRTAPAIEPTVAKRGSRDVITTRDVSVRYRLNGAAAGGRQELLALDGVTFTVSEGEILGVVGANGAGKSTLTRVLTGIMRPDRGTLKVGGRAAALLTLGAGFNDQLPGADNIYLNGLMLGMTRQRIAEVFDDIVEFAGLRRFIHEPVKHYSTGMRARLAFSIAAAMEPDILIIDEALNAGDAAFQEQAARRLQQLMVRARLVVLVSHNLAMVEQMCTRAIWLQHGKVAFDGSPGDTIARYRAASAATTP